MRKCPSTPAHLLRLFLWLAAILGAIPAAAQVHPTLPDQISDEYQPFPLRQTPVSFELNLILQPVYLWQVSGNYRLNGQKLNIPKAYAPRFYSTQPFQKAFSSIGETADQANSLYASFYLTFLENSAIPFFHHIRLVVGATHEKMEGDTTAVEYRYYDGGTEATVLLEKNFSYRLSDRQYQANGIIFTIRPQAGVFGSVAKVRTDIDYNGIAMYSTDSSRWQWPSPRNGWGWMIGANAEVGGVLCNDFFINENFTRNCCLGKGLFWFFRRVGVTVGTKIMVMGVNSADGVVASGVPGMTGGRLRISNYALFLNGPVINVRWMNLN